MFPHTGKERSFTTELGESLKRVRAVIENGLPQTRERALALTKLEECELWALRAAENDKVA